MSAEDCSAAGAVHAVWTSTARRGEILFDASG